MGHSQTHFSFIFAFSTVDSEYVQYKILPITGFELQKLQSEATTLPTEQQQLPWKPHCSFGHKQVKVIVKK